MSASVRRLLGEPFLHFLVLGAALFALYAAAGTPEPEAQEPRRIVVTQERVDRLAAGFRGVWRRDPTPAELDGLMRDFVREEVLYREALALGLDENDEVIRRRLRQKMEFIADAGAELVEPEDADLEAWLAENAETYRLPGRVAFRQVFLGETPAQEDVAAVQAALAAPDADWRAVGRRSLLPEGGRMTSRDADDLFGRGFFDALSAVEPGGWAGPVESAYGRHLVFVETIEPARAPRLDQVRDAVIRDWRADAARRIRDAQFAALRERYEIVVPGGAEAAE